MESKYNIAHNAPRPRSAYFFLASSLPAALASVAAFFSSVVCALAMLARCLATAGSASPDLVAATSSDVPPSSACDDAGGENRVG